MSDDATSIAGRETPLSDSIVSFCRFLRDDGFNVGTRESLDAVRAARLDILTRKPLFKEALRTLLCSTHDEWIRFDDLFEQYWLEGRASVRRRNRVGPTGRSTRVRRQNPLLGIGEPAEDAPDEGGESATGASELERLRRTDFSQVAARDLEELEQLVLRLAIRMRLRLARRKVPVPQRGRVDLRRTIRRSVGYGGDPLDLRYVGPKPRKPRLAALLDVSGSMDQYSFFLLRFIYALQRHFERVDAFLFSTRLTCITETLKGRRFPDTLPRLADTAEAWSSGTRIGACLATFNNEWGESVLSGDTIAFILSDGLDTGEPAILTRELSEIKRRTRKLIWLNPLSGMEGYRPTARGMAAALPLVDALVPAHNLESLLELESHLKDV